MALVGEYQMFNMWKEFFENLTVEWLIENCIEKGKLANVDQVQCPTCIDTFDISFGVYYYGGARFLFKTPPELEELRSTSDERLFEYFPLKVWNDFLRVLCL